MFWPVDNGIEAEIGVADRLFNRRDIAFVPDLNRKHPRIGHIDGRDLIERHLRAVSVDHDRIQQMRRGAPGPEPREFLLQHFDRHVHPVFDVVGVI